MKRGNPRHLFAWTMERNRFQLPNHSVGLGMGKVKGAKSEFRGDDNRFFTFGETYPRQGQAVQSQVGLHIKFQAS